MRGVEFPNASRRTVTVSQRSTAIPTQSNPAPRFDVEPGTFTTTDSITAPAPLGNRLAAGP